MSSNLESPSVAPDVAASSAPTFGASAGPRTAARAARVARPLVRAFWLLLVPAALAGLCSSVLFPNPFQARSGAIPAFLARLSAEQPVAVFVGFFLLFAWQARVWRAYLPAAAWANELPRPSTLAGNLRFSALVVLALLATFTLRSSVFATYRVLSASMLPTLRPDEWLAVNERAYGTRLPGVRYRFGAKLPERGDVIAFETPPQLLGQPARLVKRVIGLPGDRIEVQRGQVSINGWSVPFCDAGVYAYVSSDAEVAGRLVVEFLAQQAYLTVYFGGSEAFEGYTVKPGEVFVLGDNRNNSSDSRAWNGGKGAGLPLRAIEGRVPYVLLAARTPGGKWSDRLLQPLWRNLQIPGVDMTETQAGIDRCLREAPADTSPPAPHEP